MPYSDFLSFRRSLGRTPPLDRMRVRARGLELAVWTSPPVGRATPLLLVNGGMLLDHALLWPALSPLALNRQVILYEQPGRGAPECPPRPSGAHIGGGGARLTALSRARGGRRWRRLRASR